MQARTLDTDILIVGGGPAGATLARALPRSLRAILLDKRPLESPPAQADKPCGGLLAPDAQAQLFYMQLALPHEVLVHPQIFGVRARDLETGIERSFQRNYINIHRALFDRWLFSLAAEHPNVTPLAGRRLERYVQHAEGIEAFLDDGTIIHAKIIVGADGATSRVRHGLDSHPFDALDTHGCPVSEKLQHFVNKASWANFYASRKSLALQTWFAVEKTPAEYGVFFHRKISDFYSWCIPKDTALVVGTIVPWGTGSNTCGTSGLVPRERMHLLCESIQKHGYTLGEELRTESCAVLTPGLFTLFHLGQGRAFLIGEAAGLVSPSSFEGVSYAFRSALALANVLRNCRVTEGARNGKKDIPALEEYRKKLFPLTVCLRVKWIKATVIYHPVLRTLALSSGIGSTTR